MNSKYLSNPHTLTQLGLIVLCSLQINSMPSQYLVNWLRSKENILLTFFFFGGLLSVNACFYLHVSVKLQLIFI